MINRVKKRFIYFSALLQVFLIVLMSFAVAFLMSENLVSADPQTPLINAGNVGSKLPKGWKFVGEVEPGVWSYQNPAGNYIQTASGSLPEEISAKGITSEGTWYSQLYKGQFGKETLGSVGSSLLAGVAWAATAYMVVKLIGPMLGLDEGTQKALEAAVTAGSFAMGTLKAMAENKVSTFGKLSTGQGPFWTGLVVAAVVFILTYKKETTKVVSFQCMPFEPALGGAKCEECNKDPMRPCTEYRCKALGQACELLNPNTLAAQCAWQSRNDVNSPKITPNASMLKPFGIGLKYEPDKAIRPPALGSKINLNGGCLPAFTPLEFGFNTDEPAQCKIDYAHTNKFDDMAFYVGEVNYYQYSHDQKMRLPGPVNGTINAPMLRNDGNFALYTRCRDSNGNENVDEYSFVFCVDAGPDTTPPIIEEFSIPSGSYVTYNKDNIPIEVYVNEPSECRWSIDSKAYDDMENRMRCFTESNQVNANLQYTCMGNLTGIENRADNKFYFRCKDQPGKPENERWAMVQSKELILKGSQPLNIISVLPNETITGSTDVVKINLELETDDGSEDGKSICYFSPSGEKDSYIAMFETNNYLHKQTLSLVNGDYKYYFRCIDSGGNAAESSTTFKVFVDKQTPRVTRAYKQLDALKIVTDEDSECAYSLKDCNFNFADGQKMAYSNVDIKYNLYAEWKASNTYYIKCKDSYGNEPDPNKCSIVASAVELSGKSSV